MNQVCGMFQRLCPTFRGLGLLSTLVLLTGSTSWDDGTLWDWPTVNAGAAADSAGRWSGPQDIKVGTNEMSPVHAIVTPDGDLGNIVWFRNIEVFTFDLDDVNGATSLVFGDSTPGSHQMFCAGHAMSPSGDILIAGGNYWDGSDTCLVATEGWAAVYDIGTKTISAIADMPWGEHVPTWTAPNDSSYLRYYPTVTPLPNGKLVIVGGDYWVDLNSNCRQDTGETPLQRAIGIYTEGASTVWSDEGDESILDNTASGGYQRWSDMPYYPRIKILPCGYFFGGQDGQNPNVTYSTELLQWGAAARDTSEKLETFRVEPGCAVLTMGPESTDNVTILMAGGGVTLVGSAGIK